MKKFGIDVSEWQGTIDWGKVKAAGVEFALLRCGYGSDRSANDDGTFERNATECARLGIPFGVYLYSYAQDASGAASEAEHVLRLLKGLKPEYPIYYDLEDSSVANLGRAQILANSKKFVDTLEAAGYWVGIYANLNWWENYLTDAWYDIKARWVAQYNSECEYTGEYGIWQYTSSGSVAGVSGKVDCNYCYLDYPALVKEAGKNGFAASGTTTEKPTAKPKPSSPVAKPETVYTVKSCLALLLSTAQPIKPWRLTTASPIPISSMWGRKLKSPAPAAPQSPQNPLTLSPVRLSVGIGATVQTVKSVSPLPDMMPMQSRPV